MGPLVLCQSWPFSPGDHQLGRPRSGIPPLTSSTSHSVSSAIVEVTDVSFTYSSIQPEYSFYTIIVFWYYSSSWTAFIHLPIHTIWISFVYYSPSRTQSGLELHWQVTTIEVPGLRCKSISKPNPRWNELDIPGYPEAIHYLLHKYRTTWHSQWQTP